jgi:hypothetical protein
LSTELIIQIRLELGRLISVIDNLTGICWAHLSSWTFVNYIFENSRFKFLRKLEDAFAVLSQDQNFNLLPQLHLCHELAIIRLIWTSTFANLTRPICINLSTVQNIILFTMSISWKNVLTFREHFLNLMIYGEYDLVCITSAGLS